MTKNTKKEFSQIPLYIISLKDSERREKIEKLLKKYEYTYTFFDAVDGKNLSNKELKIANKSPYLKQGKIVRQISKAELACTLSHMKIYEKMINEDIPWAMIFEDDVYFHENIQKNLSLNIGKLQKDNFYHLGAVAAWRGGNV